MQLNVFTDYAFRTLTYAAVHEGRRCTADDIATAFGISRHHVIKVVNGLKHLGFLETARGRNGGFRLARRPEEIRLGDVMRQTEASLAVVECFEPRTSRCPLRRACGLKGVLAEAFEAFLAVLDRYTVADLVARPAWAAQIIRIAPPVRHLSA